MLRSVPLRRWFIAPSFILQHPLPKFTRERLDTCLTDIYVAEGLTPLLAVATTVREEPLERAWNALGGFLSLEHHEEAFADAVQLGELKPELLFPDNPEEASRLATHPAILSVKFRTSKATLPDRPDSESAPATTNASLSETIPRWI